MIIATKDPSFVRSWFLTVDKECRERVPVQETRDFIDAVLQDGRGWAKLGYRFLNVSCQKGSALRRNEENWKHVFHIRISAEDTVTRECGFSGLSCADLSKNMILLNVERWLYGAEASGLPLWAYRHYLVQHEIGHLLGRGHAVCDGDGRPRPIMTQATIANDTCSPNMWPLWDE
jgi:hypothetical protein